MERRNSVLKLVAVLCMPLLMAACGTKSSVSTDAVSGASTLGSSANATSTTKAQKNDAIEKLTFVQKVSDNQVYSKNITGNMTFSLQVGDKNVSVPGALRMRKDEVIRIQLFIPILGTEVGRLEFTPKYVLIIDRLHKEYIKADYNQVDFLQRQGINFYSLQALFWNQLLLPGTQKVSESDLKKFDANLKVDGNEIPVTFDQGDMHFTWNADRATGRINQAIVDYRAGNTKSTLQIKYADFKNVGVKLFPATQSLTLATNATQKAQKATINLKMNDVKTDSNWDAETTVSDKYKQVSPEDVLNKIMNL